ncbi:MAG: RcpC/CpaB family pilus assembly protein [Mycobacterium leprae]
MFQSRSAKLPLVIAVITFNLALLLATVTWRRVFPQVDVMVAMADTAAGVEVTKDLMTTLKMPAGAVPADAVRRPEQAVGKWTAIPLLKGEPLTTRRLQDKPPVKGDQIQSGLLSIPVNGQYALAGRLKPGDSVTFMIVPRAEQTSARDAKPTAEPKATVLLREIKVVDVRGSNGQSAAPVDEKAKESASSPLSMPAVPGSNLPATILVDVTEQQALQLVDAVESKAAIYVYRKSLP